MTAALLLPLPPPAPTPLATDPLHDFFQEWIAGLTGIAGTLVRPRWQPDPPNIPAETVNWIAFAIQRGDSETNAVELVDPADATTSQFRNHRILELKLSFYGPAAMDVGQLFIDGAQIAQNREILSTNSFGFMRATRLISVPELVKNKWYQRADLSAYVRQQIVRTYAVPSILSAHGTVYTDHPQQTIPFNSEE